jgi:hypothetical protein
MTNQTAKWFYPAFRTRITVTVGAGGFERLDKPVDLFFNFREALNNAGGASSPATVSLQVVEIGANGYLLDDQVVWQYTPFNPAFESIQVTDRLTWLMKGATLPNQERIYQVYFDTTQQTNAEPPVSRIIAVQDKVLDEDQLCYQINTPSGVYYYQKIAAGFSSLLDRDGSDWIGYHPSGGSAGNYRGIPNLAPYGFHPGYDNSTSWLVDHGSLRATLYSRNKNEEAACLWDIYSSYATLTVAAVGERPYWFLYEGTPGGKFDPENDYIVHADGRRRSAAELWDEALPEPEWLYFGSGKIPRVLYLIHHERDEFTDSYWPMEGNMTVFGFGRAPKGMPLTQYMKAAPAHFTIGFSEQNDLAAVTRIVNSAFREMTIRAGTVEHQAV